VINVIVRLALAAGMLVVPPSVIVVAGPALSTCAPTVQCATLVIHFVDGMGSGS